MAPHGTRTRYVGSKNRPGCRCAKCSKAQLTYDRKRRAGLIENVPETAHGEQGRAKYRCHCEICTAYYQRRLAFGRLLTAQRRLADAENRAAAALAEVERIEAL
jgi:hypothetical protein